MMDSTHTLLEPPKFRDGGLCCYSFDILGLTLCCTGWLRRSRARDAAPAAEGREAERGGDLEAPLMQEPPLRPSAPAAR